MLELHLFFSALLDCYVIATVVDAGRYLMISPNTETGGYTIVPLVPERIPNDLERRTFEPGAISGSIKRALTDYFKQDVQLAAFNTLSTSAMSLRALRDRLNEVIEENERRGYASRNDLPVYLRLQRGRNSWYVPVQHATSSMLTVPIKAEEGKPELVCMTLQGKEAETIKTGRDGYYARSRP
jgi:hypothetical protein